MADRVFFNSLKVACPYCKHPVNWVEKGEVTRHIPGSDNPLKHDRWRLYQCQMCNRGAMFHYVSKQGQDYQAETNEYATFPTYVPSVDVDVPEPMASIFLEALRCYGARAWNAVCTMCRRSVEESLKAKGIAKKKGETLYQRINRAAAVLHFPPTLLEIAHRIRVLGNAGAHGEETATPSTAPAASTPANAAVDPAAADAAGADADAEDDVFTNMTPDDADDAIEFCRLYFDFVHAAQERLKNAKIKRP